jgi:hypothetical protein
VTPRGSEVPPFYGVGPKDGFRVLRNKWVQRSYIEKHARSLSTSFRIGLEATRREVPNRVAHGKMFLVDRTQHGRGLALSEMHADSTERRMERALYDAFGFGSSAGSTDSWQMLVAYQVPLFDRLQRAGWGHIDLLALTADGTPVVIELKTGEATDTPLRALVEGLANAVAVQANWPAFSKEIRAACEARGLELRPDETAQTVAVQLLAPDAYWENWQPRGRLGRAVGRAARDRVAELRRTSTEAAYPIYLGSFGWPFEDSPHVREAVVDW